ncbi:MAG: hypothetical protein OSA77_11510, partial [Halioglobus sp.]|nr:hypothetical protein [Halioglobus sp.]
MTQYRGLTMFPLERLFAAFLSGLFAASISGIAIGEQHQASAQAAADTPPIHAAVNDKGIPRLEV